jgi:hypothetical protein
MSVPPINDSLHTVPYAVTVIPCDHHPQFYEFCNATRGTPNMHAFFDLYPQGQTDADYAIRKGDVLFSIRDHLGFMSAQINSIGQHFAVSSSMNGWICPRKTDFADFDHIMAIQDAARRNYAFRNAVRTMYIIWGTSMKEHTKIQGTGFVSNSPDTMPDGPAVVTTGLVDVLVTGKKNIAVGQLVCAVPPLRDEAETKATSMFGQTESRRALLIEPYEGNESMNVTEMRKFLGLEFTRKPEWDAKKAEVSVNVDELEELVIATLVEHTRKAVLHAMAMATTMAANPAFNPAIDADKAVFDSNLDKWHNKLYNMGLNTADVMMVPGFGAVTPARYVELLAADMLVDREMTGRDYAKTTHNLLGALAQNLMNDMRGILGRATTTGTPGHMMQLNLCTNRP